MMHACMHMYDKCIYIYDKFICKYIECGCVHHESNILVHMRISPTKVDFFLRWTWHICRCSFTADFRSPLVCQRDCCRGQVFSSRFMYHCDVSRGLSLEYKRIVQWDAPLLTVFCLLALTVSQRKNERTDWWLALRVGLCSWSQFSFYSIWGIGQNLWFHIEWRNEHPELPACSRFAAGDWFWSVAISKVAQFFLG